MCVMYTRATLHCARIADAHAHWYRAGLSVQELSRLPPPLCATLAATLRRPSGACYLLNNSRRTAAATFEAECRLHGLTSEVLSGLDENVEAVGGASFMRVFQEGKGMRVQCVIHPPTKWEAAIGGRRSTM